MKARPALQAIFGLAALAGVLVLLWALAGRPDLDASRIGSGLQAIGAAIELYAILIITWEPWVRPRILEVRRWLEKKRMDLQRKLHKWFPMLVPAVTHELAPSDGIKFSARMSASGEIVRKGTLEERVKRLEEDFESHRNQLALQLQESSEEAQASLDARLATLEARAVRVRTEDAVRLILGIAISLIGALWASIG